MFYTNKAVIKFAIKLNLRLYRVVLNVSQTKLGSSFILSCLTILILMDHSIHIDTISMELSILYFNGSQVEISTKMMYFTRHVKINGSPVSLTENSAVFRKTDF